MQLIFSTVVRNAPPEKGGELVWLDWDEKRIIDRVPLMTTNPTLDDPNPRGSTRGGRGLEIIGNQVFVTTYHTIKVFELCNQRLKFVRDISHPLMVGLHETDRGDTNNSIWVTSTSIDAALEIDLATGNSLNEYWPRELGAIAEQLHLEPMDIDKSADNRAAHLVADRFPDPHHLHLNAVARWQGETYALFNRYGVIVNLDKQHIVRQDEGLRGAHNLAISNGVALVNGTLSRTLRLYDIKSGALINTINLLGFPWVRRLIWRQEIMFRLVRTLDKVKQRVNMETSSPARPVFVRGLAVLEDEALVGISPASILRIEIDTGRLIDTFNYSQDVAVCIHGLRHRSQDTGPMQDEISSRE